MKPSEVFLNGGRGHPFPDTFGSADLEVAVAMLVAACALYEDHWQPVTVPMIGKAIELNLRYGRQPWITLNRSPAAPRPKFNELAEKGFARFTESERSRSPIELTERALDLLRSRWWRPDEAALLNKDRRRAAELGDEAKALESKD